MTDTVTSQNVDLSFWDYSLYTDRFVKKKKKKKKEQTADVLVYGKPVFVLLQF
jgi:hypothetical protein